MKGFCALFGLVTILLGVWSAPASADATSIGRQLFQGFATFEAGDQTTNSGRPADLIACAACHGIHGQGKSEGGSVVPSIQWQSLMANAAWGPGFKNEAELGLAIKAGVGRNGAPLSETMPRYRLTPEEARGLIDYLRVLGTELDVPRGVSSGEVRLGVMLPLSGSSAHVGSKILGGIRSTVDQANAGGGIHGRLVKLVIVDSLPDATIAADNLVNEHVYAVFASIWPRDPTIEKHFADERIAMIANLTPRETEHEIGAWSLDLLPPLDRQFDALKSNLLHCETASNRWIFWPQTTSGPLSKEFMLFTSQESIDEAFQDHKISAGCLGFGFNDTLRLKNIVTSRWQQRIVLAFPSELALQGRTSLSESLGVIAARVTLELLSASGASLHERSILENFPVLDGFEPIPGIPLRLRQKRRFALEPNVLVLDVAQQIANPGRIGTPQ